MRKLLSACLFMVPMSTAAQPISGADEPALKTAAVEWLNDENPEEALWELGELAVDGNVAARLLVNHIYDRFVPADFPDLDESQRRALLPRDGHALASIDQPYFVDEPAITGLAALHAMQNAKTPEDWIVHAEVVLSAGLKGAFLTEFRAAIDGDLMFVEVIEFADDVIALSEWEQSQIWSARGLSQIYLPYWEQHDTESAAKFLARWSNDPWNDEVATEFSQALQDQRWAAFDALGTFLVIDPPFARKVGANDTDLRWASLILGGTSPEYRGSTPTVAELQTVGEMIITDSHRSPHLLPVVQTCAEACQDDVSYCVAAAALLGGPRAHRASTSIKFAGLEPVISDVEYYTSRRAASEMVQVLSSDDVLQSNWLSFPQCLTEALIGGTVPDQ